MSLLLVQACSKSKNSTTRPIPALELYCGYYYKIIKKARREDALRSDLDLCILSAKHGIIDPETEIVEYDWRMDSERAAEIRNQVISDLRSKIQQKNYDEIILNIGNQYRDATRGIESEVDIPVTFMEGQLGERGKVLKRFVRDDFQNLVVGSELQQQSEQTGCSFEVTGTAKKARTGHLTVNGTVMQTPNIFPVINFYGGGRKTRSFWR